MPGTASTSGYPIDSPDIASIGGTVLSQAVRSAWAKHRRDDDESLSLVRHCEDAAAIAGHLWDDWLPRSTREFLTNGRSGEEARFLACWLAGVHDIGKLSPAFAIQVSPLALRMDDAGLRVPMTVPGRQDTPHSLASYNAVMNYLTKREWPGRVASTYAVVAGGHHGVPPTSGQLARSPDRSHYGGPEWAVARDELLDHISRIVGAESFIAQGWKRMPLTPQQQALWTGFVIMADWIASSDLFPLGIRDESVSTAARAWSALELPPPWHPAPPPTLDELMRVRFDLPPGATPNLVQRAVVTAASSLREPGMLIIEAPMGIGKTEAALAASEHLAARFGQRGVFMALPTMATSNAMFARVLHWIRAQGTTEDASVVLAHGKASLEDSYRGLLRRRALVDIGRDASDGKVDHGEVIAHYWLSGRKKGMLADFAVGTIDQLLFGGLKAKHLALRHLALVNKVVIVDEVHAADFYMSQYLIRILEWLGSYRVPVILMSATLPAAQRIALARAYEAGRGWNGDDSDLRGNIGYPAITVIDGGCRVESAADVRQPAQIAIERIDDSMVSLIERMRVLLATGGCVGIVRNTVARAQDTARVLSEHFPGDVVLLHSRFVARHRSDLESGLVAELGPDGTRPSRRIVVGTQVIEQSLDVDFDLLISDVAPIDLLFQRIGRLHRHDRKRPPAVAQPRVILTGVEDWTSDPPAAVPASRQIYGEFNLLRTFAVLAAREYVRLPDDIASLVQSAYADDLEFPASWIDRAEDARRAHQKRQTELANAAGKWRIWEPHESPTLRDWLAEGVGEVDDARGQAKVRDTDEGIDVLLTRRVGDVVRLLAQCGGHVIGTEFCPDDYLARRALTGSVRLPQSLTHPGIAGTTIDALEQRMYPGWQESKWLAGELVLELDSDLKARLMDYDIHYDEIEGLVVNKVGDRS